MSEKLLKGIVIDSRDWRDNDKIIKILTFEEGIVTASIKGVKKHKAKLKFGAMPFAFCEYMLSEKGSFTTVINCSLIEDFFNITQDYDKYICGSIILQSVNNACNKLVAPEFFLLLLKCLKSLVIDNTDPYLTAAFFIVKLLLLSGYGEKYPISDNPKTSSQLLGLLNSVKTDKLKSFEFSTALCKESLQKAIAKAEYHLEQGIECKKLLD